MKLIINTFLIMGFLLFGTSVLADIGTVTIIKSDGTSQLCTTSTTGSITTVICN